MSFFTVLCYVKLCENSSYGAMWITFWNLRQDQKWLKPLISHRFERLNEENGETLIITS